jgi:outer membrane protein insertion porin family
LETDGEKFFIHRRINRNNKGVNQFSNYGSEFSLSAKLLVNEWNEYATLGDQEEYKLKNTVERSNQVDANGNTVSIGDYIDSAGNKVFAFQMPPLTLQKWIKRNLIG